MDYKEDLEIYREIASLFSVKDSVVQEPKYSAVIEIGNWHIQLTNKTFTKRQIKHMKKYFGWEVRNIDES